MSKLLFKVILVIALLAPFTTKADNDNKIVQKKAEISENFAAKGNTSSPELINLRNQNRAKLEAILQDMPDAVQPVKVETPQEPAADLISIEPKQIDFGQVETDSLQTATITIGAKKDKEIRILSVDMDIDHDTLLHSGYEYTSDCREKILRDTETCVVTLNWRAFQDHKIVAKLVVNWRENNSPNKVRQEEIPLTGNAITSADKPETTTSPTPVRFHPPFGAPPSLRR